MISRGLEAVEFIAANTDSQALMRNPAGTKIQLGSNTTRGLGAGANPDVGRAAVEESIEEIRDALRGADMVFVTAGMGGGTGTGAAPVIAREARDLGALVVGIVTRPFSFENRTRARQAEAGVRDLREEVDALIVIPNDRILSVVDASVPFREALEKADEVLYNATKGIADIVSHEGIINVDFADVVTVMKSQGDALMGIGTASGERRALEAAQNALNSPILEGMQIYGAKGLLVNITGSPSLTMHEVNEAVSCVQKAAGEEANLIHGVVIDTLMDDEISITVVATGFHRTEEHKTEQSVPRITIVRGGQNEPDPTERSDDETEPDYYRPAATAGTSRILKPSAAIDPNDVEQPAIWRRKKLTHAEAGFESDVRPAVKIPPNADSHVASSQQNESQPAPGTFLRPAKTATSGGGNSQPAFLRKIMD
jgi:cell division protein FtsZ